MKYKATYFLLLVGWLLALPGCSQHSRIYAPTTDTIRHQFGDSTISVVRWQYATSKPLQLLLLHHNEQTAHTESMRFSTEEGLEYIQLLNNSQRLIAFAVNDTVYRFDPNRMFSTAGIAASLEKESQLSDTARQVVWNFASAMLQLLDTTKTIVAVHNNTPGWFSLLNYVNDSSSLVHQNPEQDTDDFFLTNDVKLFERLRSQNFNVVLERAELVVDDGSLSILFGKRKWRYVNVEAEHGHATQQQLMLQVLRTALMD